MKTRVETPAGIIEVEVTNAERLEDIIERVEGIEVEHSDGWFMVEQAIREGRPPPPRQDILKKWKEGPPPPPLVLAYIHDLLDPNIKASKGGRPRLMTEASASRYIESKVLRADLAWRVSIYRKLGVRKPRQAALAAIQRERARRGVKVSISVLEKMAGRSWGRSRGPAKAD